MQIDVSSTLDPEQIRVLNWNLQKQSNRLWNSEDLRALSGDIDLALFQEVHLADDFLASFEERWCHSFTRGYTTRSRMTGVMTLATADHLSHNQLVINEPVLRTPKATNITTYALDGSAEKLLVINLHAVNFSLGIRAYERQLRAIVRVIDGHAGPVIFAGDFNAWHPKRERLIRAVAALFHMEEVMFDEDHRTRVFGYCLDYMFARGLRTHWSQTPQVRSSDHNPMLVSFSL